LFEKITLSSKEKLAGFTSDVSMINTCTIDDDDDDDGIDEIGKFK
jgi:tRNA A37 methylthiotransferase MiaB